MGKPGKTSILSYKISPLAYFATKLARISHPIAFQMICETILFGLVSQNIHWENVSEAVLRCTMKQKFIFASYFSRSHFPLVPPKKSETSWRNGCSYKKSKASWLAACLDQVSCFCLVSASKPIIDQLTWHTLTTRLSSYWLGARALAPGDWSWSLWGCGPNSATSSNSGSSKDFFAIDDWCAAICWLVLGDPWKACLQPHKIGQSPTRRFSKKTPQLVSILVLK